MMCYSVIAWLTDRSWGLDVKKKQWEERLFRNKYRQKTILANIFYSHISIPGASNLNEASFPLCLILFTPSQILRSEDKIINQSTQ